MRRIHHLLLASVAGIGAVNVAAATPASTVPTAVDADTAIDEIIAVEREFAKESVAIGPKKSFLHYSAPDGVIFRPGPVPAVETINRDSDDDPRDGYLDWFPSLAAVSRSADLGFSVGPWKLHNNKAKDGQPADRWGYYCTIWERQADGRWKFVIDGAGAGLGDGIPTRMKGDAVERLPVPALIPGGSESTAMREVSALEAELAAASRLGLAQAIIPHYSPRAWVMGSEVEVVEGAKGWTNELKRRPAQVTLTTIGSGASKAGDMAYVYGSVGKAGEDDVLPGASFLHIWMRDAGGWKIVFDGFKRGRRQG